MSIKRSHFCFTVSESLIFPVGIYDNTFATVTLSNLFSVVLAVSNFCMNSSSDIPYFGIFADFKSITL